jgi:hypothetical protein
VAMVSSALPEDRAGFWLPLDYSPCWILGRSLGALSVLRGPALGHYVHLSVVTCWEPQSLSGGPRGCRGGKAPGGPLLSPIRP